MKFLRLEFVCRDGKKREIGSSIDQSLVTQALIVPLFVLE